MGGAVRTGILLNLIGAILIAPLIHFIAMPMLGISAGTLPVWVS